MSLGKWFGKSPKRSLDDLIRGNDRIKMRDLLSLDEIQCRPDIVSAAIKLLQDPNHSHDGYDILGILAEEGDLIAQYIMGDFCESVLDRPVQAAIWFQRAAEQGLAKAQHAYADMLMVGKGLERNPALALEWYTKAAEQGIPEAQFAVGEFYRNGSEIPKDIKKAAYWYKMAKEGGFEPAEMRLKQIDVELPTNNEDDLTELDKQILKLPESVIRSAEQGIDYYAGRNGVKQDYKKAFPLSLHAAQEGHISAQYAVAIMYFRGEGITQDLKQAIYWFEESAKGGMAAAQNELAKLFYNGVGCTQDIKGAAYWSKKAADNGIPEAMYTYGAMLTQGIGVMKDQARGLEYVKMAAQRGHIQAQTELKQLRVPY
ncbi:MAG: SEL1-like repeat protein [Syntrophorhabdaceae bacterium]